MLVQKWIEILPDSNPIRFLNFILYSLLSSSSLAYLQTIMYARTESGELARREREREQIGMPSMARHASCMIHISVQLECMYVCIPIESYPGPHRHQAYIQTSSSVNNAMQCKIPACISINLFLIRDYRYVVFRIKKISYLILCHKRLNLHC